MHTNGILNKGRPGAVQWWVMVLNGRLLIGANMHPGGAAVAAAVIDRTIIGTNRPNATEGISAIIPLIVS